MKPRVGVLYNGTLDTFLDRHAGAVDFVSVIPDRFWTDFGRGAARRFVPLPDETISLERLASRFPLIAHGVGLSIASAASFDADHVRELGRWRQRYGFLLVSEHLAAFRVRSAATVDHHSGLQIPLPWDDDVLAMLAERVARSQDSLGAQLLLENGVVHTPVRDSDMSEAAFMNELTHRSGCGLLLDLHNLYVNSVNLGIDADAFLDELDLSTVREIHVAGGNELFGVYLDSHAGACPEPVWRLLARAAPRCRSLACVTFEFHESYYPRLGEAGILAEIARIRQTLREATGDEPCRSPTFNAPLPI